MTTGAVNREYCLFCDEPVKREPPDYLDVCSTHGVLEGITDEEWINHKVPDDIDTRKICCSYCGDLYPFSELTEALACRKCRSRVTA